MVLFKEHFKVEGAEPFEIFSGLLLWLSGHSLVVKLLASPSELASTLLTPSISSCTGLALVPMLLIQLL